MHQNISSRRCSRRTGISNRKQEVPHLRHQTHRPPALLPGAAMADLGRASIPYCPSTAVRSRIYRRQTWMRMRMEMASMRPSCPRPRNCFADPAADTTRKRSRDLRMVAWRYSARRRQSHDCISIRVLRFPASGIALFHEVMQVTLAFCGCSPRIKLHCTCGVQDYVQIHPLLVIYTKVHINAKPKSG